MRKRDESRVYIELTQEYLKGLNKVLSIEDKKRYNNSDFLITECFRHCLCKALEVGNGFDSSVRSISMYEKRITEILKQVCSKYKLENQSEETRKAILQMCIHIIEKYRVDLG